MLLNQTRVLALIKKGNLLNFSVNGESLRLEIAGKIFTGNYFELKPQEADQFIFYNGRRYRGYLKFVSNGSEVQAINRVTLGIIFFP